MHKVFISYHHGNGLVGDAAYKERLLDWNRTYRIFIDGSVDIGEISEDLPDQRIREIIRDEYLRDSTVTIVLVGLGTRGRKHVDWEIYSSMRDGARNKKSGVLAIMLPSTRCQFFWAAHEGEREVVYPSTSDWLYIDERAEFDRRFPHMPDRLIDNLMAPRAKVSVTTWATIEADPRKLAYLIECAHCDRTMCEYDLSRPMRRASRNGLLNPLWPT